MQLTIVALFLTQLYQLTITKMPDNYGIKNQSKYKRPESKVEIESSFTQVASILLFELKGGVHFPQISILPRPEDQQYDTDDRGLMVGPPQSCANTGAFDPMRVADSRGYTCQVKPYSELNSVDWEHLTLHHC